MEGKSGLFNKRIISSEYARTVQAKQYHPIVPKTTETVELPGNIHPAFRKIIQKYLDYNVMISTEQVFYMHPQSELFANELIDLEKLKLQFIRVIKPLFLDLQAKANVGFLDEANKEYLKELEELLEVTFGAGWTFTA